MTIKHWNNCPIRRNRKPKIDVGYFVAAMFLSIASVLIAALLIYGTYLKMTSPIGKAQSILESINVSEGV